VPVYIASVVLGAKIGLIEAALGTVVSGALVIGDVPSDVENGLAALPALSL